MDSNILLKAFFQKGLLSKEAIDKVAEDLKFLKKSAEEVLYERRLIDENDILKVKSEILGIPFKRIKPQDISDDLLKIVPEETARTYKVLPISKNNEMLVVGMVYPDDIRAQDALKFIAKRQQADLGVYLISIADFAMVIKKYSPYKSEVDAAMKTFKSSAVSKKGELHPSQRIVQLDENTGVSEEAPVIKIVASTLQEAVDQGASDIHIEPQRSDLRIRFRLDGDLKEVSSFPLELHQPIISRIKVLSNLKIDENRIPQDGRFRTILSGRDIDFRVSTFPTPVGEKIALRILDPTVGLKSLDDLGLAGKNSEIINKGISKPFGMVLITGPTGSGKTTTLYALMQILNKESVNVVSLEDPVEYFMDGINQSQVKPEIGYTFASGLRQILRQDPDVIMVGEIRDSETAELAVHSALTGHIVLSTLHTNNATGVIPRLIDMGIQKFLLPSALNLMASQRLAPKICQYCKKEEKPSAEITEIIKEALEVLPPEFKKEYKEPFKIYHGEGCAKCKNKGISGRIALFEVFEMTRSLGAIIQGEGEGIEERKILEEARSQNMITLRQDGVLKALKGIVTIESVLRETEE